MQMARVSCSVSAPGGTVVKQRRRPVVRRRFCCPDISRSGKNRRRATVMRTILSVFDKRGIAEFAAGLRELGAEIFSTGNTKAVIASAGVPVHGISDLTGFPEILDGRVKTLHPAVHGGLLARRDLPEHMRELEANGVGTIELVAGNLYPFVKTVASGADLTTALENIDIGGPTM